MDAPAHEFDNQHNIEIAANLFQKYLLENFYKHITTDKMHGRTFTNNLYSLFGIQISHIAFLIRNNYLSKRALLKNNHITVDNRAYFITQEISASAIDIARELITNYEYQLNNPHFGATGKKGSTFFKKVCEFIEVSDVISQLSVHELARYTLCQIRTDLSDVELENGQSVAYSIRQAFNRFDDLSEDDVVSRVEQFRSNIYESKNDKLNSIPILIKHVHWFTVQPQVVQILGRIQRAAFTRETGNLNPRIDALPTSSDEDTAPSSERTQPLELSEEELPWERQERLLRMDGEASELPIETIHAAPQRGFFRFRRGPEEQGGDKDLSLFQRIRDNARRKQEAREAQRREEAPSGTVLDRVRAALPKAPWNRDRQEEEGPAEFFDLPDYDKGGPTTNGADSW